ncbi:hypothetical protein [Variovorax sp. YR752]|nr:hypothetical protein [Variovorax sp. YR752]
MAEPMTTIKGKVVLSANDIPEMRQTFAGPKLDPLSIADSVGSA